MRDRVVLTASAGVLAIALMDAPSSALQGQYSLALATGHELAWPKAKCAPKQQNYKYDRRPLNPRERGYQWDPWGHWGSYYGPMIH